MQHSKYTREQELILKDELTYKSAWHVLHSTLPHAYIQMYIAGYCNMI